MDSFPYTTTPSIPNTEPIVTVEQVGITKREFELIRLLRRIHFWDGRDRLATVLKRNGKPLVFDGVQVAGDS